MSPIYWSWINISGSLKRIYDNVIHGWNDTDLWGLDVPFAKWLLPRLKRFRAMDLHGFPVFSDYPKDYPADEAVALAMDSMFERRWMWIIDQIIWSCEYMVLDNWMGLEELEKHFNLQPGKYDISRLHHFFSKKCNRGMRFFVKYIRSIAD